MKKNKKIPIDKLDRLEKGTLSFAVILFLFITITSLFGQKIGQISSVVGVRDNQLIGYGLVVGLAGSGDGTSTFTGQTLANFLKTVNIQVDQNAIKSKNVAAVMITTDLKPFSRQGDKIDAMVSSIGDAKSLKGGTLLMTPLKGVDGKTYAIAQGAISLGGFETSTHTTVGKVFSGATVEQSLNYDLYNKQRAVLSLKTQSFKNAVAIEQAINKKFKNSAMAVNPRSIKLTKPKNINMVAFLAKVKDLNVALSIEEKIVIDERTGTIIAGTNIEISPVVITHKDISLSIDNSILKNGEKLTIANITKVLQKLGAAPKDIIAILQAIKKSGACTATLEVL